MEQMCIRLTMLFFAIIKHHKKVNKLNYSRYFGEKRLKNVNTLKYVCYRGDKH